MSTLTVYQPLEVRYYYYYTQLYYIITLLCTYTRAHGYSKIWALHDALNISGLLAIAQAWSIHDREARSPVFGTSGAWIRCCSIPMRACFSSVSWFIMVTLNFVLCSKMIDHLYISEFVLGQLLAKLGQVLHFCWTCMHDDKLDIWS